MALYVYMFNASMTNKAYCNTDGDFLICPQQGTLDIQTEMGMLFVQPGEICVIQRGVRFAVRMVEGESACRGYITEVGHAPFNSDFERALTSLTYRSGARCGNYRIWDHSEDMVWQTQGTFYIQWRISTMTCMFSLRLS